MTHLLTPDVFPSQRSFPNPSREVLLLPGSGSVELYDGPLNQLFGLRHIFPNVEIMDHLVRSFLEHLGSFLAGRNALSPEALSVHRLTLP
jgi:hypothetical protein